MPFFTTVQVGRGEVCQDRADFGFRASVGGREWDSGNPYGYQEAYKRLHVVLKHTFTHPSTIKSILTDEHSPHGYRVFVDYACRPFRA